MPKSVLKKNLITFIKREGIDLRTNTNAKGNLGLFKENRIDIHKKLTDEQFIEVLLHEYAHLIHNELESNMPRNGGSLEVLFDTNEVDTIKNELIAVSNLVDENSKLLKFDSKKYAYKIKIKSYENLIKNDYPNFLRTKPFKEFEKYIKNSDARFLLKYDKVKILTPFLRKEKIYSIDTIEKDFPKMPKAFALYIRICSLTRKARNIQTRKCKLKKYYEKPSELFARFVQGLYIYENDIKILAPTAYSRFIELTKNNYYGALKKVIAIINENRI